MAHATRGAFVTTNWALGMTSEMLTLTSLNYHPPDVYQKHDDLVSLLNTPVFIEIYSRQIQYLSPTLSHIAGTERRADRDVKLYPNQIISDIVEVCELK